MTEKEFLDIIEANKGIIYKVSRIYFDEKNDREDLFQEIVIRTWNSIHTFKGQSAFSSWLYKVALNTAIVHFKKNKKRREKIIGPIPSNFKQPLTQSSKEDQLTQFYRAVKQLNRIEKALILQYIDGLSGQQIGENLGLTPINVRVKTNRVKAKLKAIIEKQSKDEL